jgi:branched-subunit amino acid transport protein AzlD
MARQKANWTFRSVAICTHKSYFCCIYLFIILKSQRANNSNKLHTANRSCVFCSLLVVTCRHDMQLGTKKPALTYQREWPAS